MDNTYISLMSHHCIKGLELKTKTLQLFIDYNQMLDKVLKEMFTYFNSTIKATSVLIPCPVQQCKR